MERRHLIRGVDPSAQIAYGLAFPVLPEFQTMMRPLLVMLDDGQERTSNEIQDWLAREFSLTATDLAERTPRGPHTRFVNLVAWALHHFSRACLIERRRPAVYRITERGQRVLVAHPTTVDIKVCAQFDEWHHSRARRAARGPSPVGER